MDCARALRIVGSGKARTRKDVTFSLSYLLAIFWSISSAKILHGVAAHRIVRSLFTMEPIRTLFARDAAEPAGDILPHELHERYDGNLCFPPAPENRPYYIANFVSTLDGVVSFNL